MTIPSVHIGVGFGWLTMPANLIAKNILMVYQTYGVRDYVISAPFGNVSLVYIPKDTSNREKSPSSRPVSPPPGDFS